MLKTIASNTLAQLVAKCVGAGLTFLTTIIIIRLSGPALYGDLTKSLVLIAIAFTVIDFGLNALAVRSFAKVKNQKALLGGIITTRLALALLAIIGANMLVFFLPGGYGTEIRSVFWIGSVAIIFQGISTSINAWFQYKENYWYTSCATIVGAVVVAGLTYLSAIHSPTLANFLISYTLGYAITAIVSVIFTHKNIELTHAPQRVITMLKKSATLGLILLASVAASKVDTIILGIYRSSSEVGEYGFAYRIFDVLLVLPVFIMNAVYPRLVKGDKKHAASLIKSSLQVLGMVSVIAGATTWFVAPWILMIRPGLTLSVHALRLLGLSLPFFFLTAPLMWQLISQHRENIVLRIYIFAALLNTSLNLLFVPSHGALAAALATGATELSILVSLLYYSSRSK